MSSCITTWSTFGVFHGIVTRCTITISSLTLSAWIFCTLRAGSSFLTVLLVLGKCITAVPAAMLEWLWQNWNWTIMQSAARLDHEWSNAFWDKMVPSTFRQGKELFLESNFRRTSVFFFFFSISVFLALHLPVSPETTTKYNISRHFISIIGSSLGTRGLFSRAREEK